MSYLRNLARAVAGRTPVPAAPRRLDSLDLRPAAFRAHDQAQKASAVGRLIASTMLGQPVWPRRDFEQLAREGYQQNPVVARSVDLIASGVANIRFELHRGRGKHAVPMEDHPLLDLLRNPNPAQDGHDLVQALVSNLVLAGNAYLERTSEDGLDRAELFVLRPDRVRVVPGEMGYPMAYEYTVGGRTKRFANEPDRRGGQRPILHLKRFHPTDDWYGMSTLDPAAWSIDTHSAAAAHNKALLENGATPTGALVYTGNKDGGQALTEDQYAQLNQALEERMSGPKNAGRPMILDGGLDWRQFGLTLENLQFVDAKNQAAREIAFSLGVPPMLLGIPGDNTYSNYVEANRAFYRSTIIPHAERLARALTQWFAPMLERDMHLVVDLDSIEALAVEREALWNKLDKSTFVTLDEKREALGYQALPGGAGAYVYQSAGLLPLGADADGAIAGGPEPDPAEADPAGDGKVTPLRRRLN